MTDEQFSKLCNTFGFAPSRALREMLDAVTKQEREACAEVCDELVENRPMTGAGKLIAQECAAAIRARSNT